MQRRELLGKLAAVAVAGLLLVSATGAFAAQLGNDASSARSMVDGLSNLAFVDVDPQFTITADSKLNTWHIYAQAGLAQNEGIDLLVWRPTAAPRVYELVVRDSVIVTAGDGEKLIAASAAAKTKTVKSGDVLGFYVPASALPVIGVDYVGAWPNEAATLGGSSWLEGEVVSFPDIYWTLARSYSLNADLDPVTGPVPEPMSIVALSAGLGALVLRRKRLTS